MRIRLLLPLFSMVSALVYAQGGVPSDSVVAPPWKEVRAVLVTRCVRCHGGETVKSSFRLADAASFASGGARGAVIDRAAPRKSRLLHVVSYDDPDLAMPPSGRLPEAEIALIRRWVLAGAPWPKGEAGRLAAPGAATEHPGETRDVASWWAYRPLEDVAIARDQDEHPVDAHLRHRREAQALELAPEAPPETLLRRATFELTGLPPTPEEAERFAVAVSARGVEAALGQLVDELLSRPQYGEHWGRHWLDLVRYAETNGYERDATKTNAWRYRDWVIRALNAGMPYDRFVSAQLAGDEIARRQPPTGEAFDPALATGYFRLGVWDDEPADPEQARADEIADIVDVTGQVLLGATVGCARCHDHKADPISQEDYYAFTAWFANVRGFGGGAFGAQRGGGLTQDVADPPGPGVLAFREREARLQEIDARLAPHLEALREAVRTAGEPESPRHLVRDARREAPVWRYHVGKAIDQWNTPGFDDGEWLEGKAGFGRKGTPGALLGTPWHGPSILLRRRFRLTDIPASLVLTLHHDEDVAVYLNGVLVFERAGYRTDYTDIQLAPEARDALVVGSNVLAVSCRQTGGGQYVDVGLRTGWTGTGDAAWRHRLRVEGLEHLGADHGRQAQALLDRRRDLLAAPVAHPYPAQVVTERGGVAPDQHVLLRGSAHAPGKVVAPAIPAAFRVGSREGAEPKVPEPDAKAPSTGRRSALARWIVGPGRHLTARVMANRLWHHHFGRGLCRTTGDFGRLGEAPTHPELLDHLAAELIRRKWSLKAMHRYLMASRFWRLASQGAPGAEAADPRNDHYSRRDPRRQTAEQFRDSVLAVSGTLNRKSFGPSVYPPLPREVLATASRPGAAWGRSSVEEASRRSVYVFVKRSLRPPLFESLDQPDPDLPCTERFPTNVPTQALMTLNGAFIHDAAARFAERLEKEDSDLEGRIARGLRLALGRPVTAEEVQRHRDFIRTLRARHGLDERAALRLFCVAVFNLNEFLWID